MIDNKAIAERDNPLGVEGFEFIEYASPKPRELHALFLQLGFAPIARHRRRAITLYRQGDINFLLNEEPDSFAARFAAEHGPCCTGFALRVADAEQAYQSCIAKGAESMTDIAGALDGPRIAGIGGSMRYLGDRKDGNARARASSRGRGARPVDLADPAGCQHWRAKRVAPRAERCDALSVIDGDGIGNLFGLAQ